jgi:hypothetical protein
MTQTAYNFAPFWSGSVFGLGLNTKWTSQTCSGAFSPAFGQLAEPNAGSGLAFADFAEEPDWTGLWQH